MSYSLVEELTHPLDDERSCLDLVATELDGMSIAALASCSKSANGGVQPSLRQARMTAHDARAGEAGRAAAEMALFQARPSLAPT